MDSSSNLLFSLVLSLSFTYLSVAADIRLCDINAEYDVKVSGVDISPNPVAKGKPATFSISAATEKAISGGKLLIDVSFLGWHVHSETHDLCAQTSCPATGDFVIANSQVLPGFTPSGSYSLKMTIVDENKKHLSCIGFDFSIGSASSVASI